MRKTDYDKEYYLRGVIRGFVVRLVRPLTNMSMGLMARKLKGRKMILEIGCGEGNISQWLSLKGFKIVAIDISKEAIGVARKEKSAVNYFCGDIFDLKSHDSCYDAVLGLHVMEHIENIEGTLREIYRVIKIGGKLIIRIPNGNSLEAKLAGRNWFHWDEPYHIYHWTATEMVEMLRKAGFEQVEVNFSLLEFKQVLLYSVLNYLGVRKISDRQKLLLLPLQLIFVPLSFILGAVFKNSGTVELVARKA